jgi:hypothetical protein
VYVSLINTLNILTDGRVAFFRDCPMKFMNLYWSVPAEVELFFVRGKFQ